MAREYYFIGIAGIGMSALAIYCLQRGYKVYGSDPSNSPFKEKLRRLGAVIHDEQRQCNIDGWQGSVVYSSDIPPDNAELALARQRGKPLLHRSDLLALLIGENDLSCAVAGTHGKTTTSALLTEIFIAAGWDPSFALGGLLLSQDTNGRGASKKVFVAEADESDATFLRYRPTAAILTNIDNDHLDHYGGMEQLKESFSYFAAAVQQPKYLVWNGDDAALRSLMLPGIALGESHYCVARISNIRQQGWQQLFDLAYKDVVYKDVLLNAVGRHNAHNAAAALLLAQQLGVPEEALRGALCSFQGVKRRCNRLFESPSLTIIDDYAHHPTEVEVTLAAIRQAVAPRRLVALLQPHRYSRLVHTWHLLPKALCSADMVVLTDVYAAREKAPAQAPLIADIAAAISQESPCHYLPHAQVVSGLESLLRDGDVVVALGAGDITYLAAALAQRCRTREQAMAVSAR